MNRERRTAVLATALSTGALAALVLAPAALASGTTEFSRKQVAAIVSDVDPGKAAKCYIAGHADSDRAWAILTYRNPVPRGCTPTDGYWILHKTATGWVDSAQISADIACQDLRRELRQAKAPVSVFTDFKSSGVCRTN